MKRRRVLNTPYTQPSNLGKKSEVVKEDIDDTIYIEKISSIPRDVRTAISNRKKSPWLYSKRVKMARKLWGNQ